MNKLNNKQIFPEDRRKTRSIEVTPEDIHYLEIDYIDSYYSKKKKKNFPSILKNESNLPPEYEETNMSRNTEISKEQGCDPLNGFNHKEKELSEKDKIQETHISLENAPVTLPPKMEFELNLNNRERINKEKAEVSTSPKKKLQPKKAEISIQKRQNIFNVEVAKCSEIQVTSKAKVPRSRKKLDENTNGQENPVFKKPNGAKQMNKIIDKSNETHKNENDSTHMAQEKEKTSVKNSSSLSLISQQEPAILEKLSQCINKDLNRIYNEFIKLKVLGRKRMNSSKLEIGLDLDEKNLGKTYSTEVELKCRKQSINESPSKETLKYNLYNPNYENIFKKLDILKLFTNSSPDLDNEIYFNNIPNFYDDSIRREYANSLNFIKTFQEDYAPIQLQKDNEKFFEKIENEENFKTQSDAISVAGSISTEITSNQTISKTHFIKKKQSALNIKRRCGVSYVVQSESQQLNVEHKYSKLGHLIYQGTHSVDQIQDEQIIKYIDNLITTELTNSPVIAVAFESPDEVEMKNFLLFPSKRLEIAKEIFILETIDEIWKFSKDKFFFAINLLFDQDKGIRNFTVEELKRYSNKELLEMSEIHVGILFRKATSGIKSVLKLYKSGGFDKILHSSSYKLCNMNEEDSIDRNIEKYSGLNMTTMSMRIELYVPELQWKSAGVFTKEFLYTFICRLEEKISSLILNWNEYRYTMYLLTKDGKVREYIHNCPYYTLNSQITSNEIPSTKTQAGETKFELNLHHFNNIKDATFPKITENKIDLSKSELLSQSKIKVHNSFADKLSLINNLTFNNLPNPMYVISTRDCFVFDLIVKSEIFEFEGRKILKKEFFFHENNIPANFYKFQTDKNELRVGVVTYENFYTSDELDELENCVERTEEYSLKDAFLPETAQKTFSGDKIKRTKFFFGSRYMWTKKQLSEPNSYVGAGIRKDVSPPPFWMREKVEDPLVKAGIILKNFVNSFAMNVYHDGTEGLGQHFDDAVRFKQPIYTLRLFSDCRLSFGSQLYGFCNGAFTIPLPRGCICIMEENSYASNGVKHCIRPCDMTGKSSALILRQMHPNMMSEAEKYDYHIDFPCWFSSLSINPNSIPFTQQKSIEADMLIKLNEIEKKKIQLDNSIHLKEAYLNEEIVDILNSMINSVEYYTETYVPSMTLGAMKKRRGRGVAKDDY